MQSNDEKSTHPIADSAVVTSVQYDSAKWQELLSIRQEVAQILSRSSRLATGEENRWLDSLLQKLESTNSPEKMLHTPQLLQILPILSAYQRNDFKRFEQQLDNLLKHEHPRTWKNRLGIGYGTFILLTCLILLLFQAHFVSPIFESIYEDFRLNIPPLTNFFLWMGQFLRSAGLLVLLAIFFLVFFRDEIYRVAERSCVWLQSIPIFGALFSGARVSLKAMRNFVAILAELLYLDVAPQSAIQFAGLASGHAFYSKHSASLSRWWAWAGQQTSVDNSDPYWDTGEKPFIRARQFPRAFPPLIEMALRQSADEPDSTRGQEMLRDMANVYSQRMDSIRRSSAGLMTPVAVVIIAIVVAAYALSLFLPFFGLITSLS